MNEIVPPPRNLEDWSSNRLKILLEEYESALPRVRALYGSQHPDSRTYELWVKALQQELEKRERRKNERGSQTI